MRKFLRRLRYYYLCFGVRGLLFGIRERLSDQPSLVSVIPPGTKHPLYLRLKTSDLRTYGQVFVSQEYEFELVRPPQVIVDAGANIGLASIYYAIRYPAAKVLALEPAYANFLMLEKNTAPYPNILPIRAALWKENTEIELIDPGYGYWGFQTIGPLGVLKKVDMVLTGQAILALHIHPVSHSPISAGLAFVALTPNFGPP